MIINCQCGNEVKFDNTDVEYCLGCGRTLFREHFDMQLMVRQQNSLMNWHVDEVEALREVAAEMVEHGFELRIYRGEAA